MVRLPDSSRRPLNFILLTYRAQNSDETVVKPAAEFKGGLYCMQNGSKSRSVQKLKKKKTASTFKHKANPHKVLILLKKKTSINCNSILGRKDNHNVLINIYFQKSQKQKRANAVIHWQSTCFACMRPWALSPTLLPLLPLLSVLPPHNDKAEKPQMEK